MNHWPLMGLRKKRKNRTYERAVLESRLCRCAWNNNDAVINMGSSFLYDLSRLFHSHEQHAGSEPDDDGGQVFGVGGLVESDDPELGCGGGAEHT